MNYSSFKEKGKDILDDACETVSYGVHSPLSFAADVIRGTGLLARKAITGNDASPIPRLCDDRAKRCAMLTWVGILALGVLSSGVFVGYKRVYKYKTNVPQSVSYENVR